jgi:hypothetical protein
LVRNGFAMQDRFTQGLDRGGDRSNDAPGGPADNCRDAAQEVARVRGVDGPGGNSPKGKAENHPEQAGAEGHAVHIHCNLRF